MLRDLFRRFFLTEMLKGLWLAFRYQFRPAFTTEYPEQEKPKPERFRGILRVDFEKCIACQLCAKACPTDCIVLEGERIEGRKQLYATKFDIDLTHCMFCYLCVDPCPTDAIFMSKDYEIADFTKHGLLFDKDRIIEGPPAAEFPR